MFGTLGGSPRMPRLVARRANFWNAWIAFGDSATAAYGPLRAAMEAACERHGRDPATPARNVTVDIALPGHATLVPAARPLTAGTVESLARAPEQLQR